VPPSGHRVVRLLVRLGFQVVEQEGSHVKLRRVSDDQTLTVTVPLHRELKRGTLSGIAEQAGMKLRELERLA